MKRILLTCFILLCTLMSINAQKLNFMERKLLGNYSTHINKEAQIENGTQNIQYRIHTEYGLNNMFKENSIVTVVYNLKNKDYENKMTFVFKFQRNGIWNLKDNILYNKVIQGKCSDSLVSSDAALKDDNYKAMLNIVNSDSVIMSLEKVLKANSKSTILAIDDNIIKLRSNNGDIRIYKRVK